MHRIAPLVLDRAIPCLKILLLFICANIVVQTVFPPLRPAETATIRFDPGQPEIEHGIQVGHHLRIEPACICHTARRVTLFAAPLCGPRPPHIVDWPECNCPTPPVPSEGEQLCHEKALVTPCLSEALFRLWVNSLFY